MTNHRDSKNRAKRFKGKGWFRQHDQSKLRLILFLFLLALLIPSLILINQAYSQLKWESYHQYQSMAEELALRINNSFNELIEKEEARAFTDYSFIQVQGDPSASYIQRSPLSALPAEQNSPGLVGYFQIDAKGQFSTPLLPINAEESIAYGISRAELNQRLTLQERIQQILSQNKLAPKTVAKSQLLDKPLKDADIAEHQRVQVESEYMAPAEEAVSSQAAFDRLARQADTKSELSKSKASNQLGRVEDLRLSSNYRLKEEKIKQEKRATQRLVSAKPRLPRKEQSAIPSSVDDEIDEPVWQAHSRQSVSAEDLKIKLFESEVDPFEFSLLDSGHFVLYRKVWRNGERMIQGAILDQNTLFQGLIESAFRETALSEMSELIVAYQGNVLSAFSGMIDRGYLTRSEELLGEMLYRTPLLAPFSDLELIFSIQHLPSGQGGKVIAWSGLILAVVLFLGTYLIYRLGVKQLALIRQQQDFVSSVSHELKTPLTSIRMYGEILKQGWASEEKKQEYYHFIFDESERLSRLISNVLQLARMNHNELVLDLKPMTVGELLDMIRSKIANQVDAAGYQLNLSVDQKTSDTFVEVDADCFSQIIINLVDNAIKFSAKAETKAIDISAQIQPRDVVTFSVRDYGPGVPKKQLKKIFELFYRAEAEMTRETVGTGIGLALVKNLVSAMDGKVDVINQEPGATFCISFASIIRH